MTRNEINAETRRNDIPERIDFESVAPYHLFTYGELRTVHTANYRVAYSDERTYINVRDKARRELSKIAKVLRRYES